MGDTNRTAVRYLKESQWGVTPASPLINTRITGESLNADVSYITSNELRADRQVTDLVQVSQEASGGYNFELSYLAFDSFFEGALQNVWDSAVSVAGTDIAVDGTAETFTSTTTDFATEGIVPGQFIKVAGFTETANNGVFLVTAVTANLLTIGGGADLTTEVAGDSVTMVSQRLVNGTSRQSFTIEKEFEDLSPDVFISYNGMVCSTMNLTINSQETVVGGFTFLGQKGTVAAVTVGTGGPTAAPTNGVINAAAHVGELLEGGAPLGTGEYIRNITIDIENNLRGKPALKVIGNADIGMGRFNMTGTMQVYFENKSIYEKYLNDTASSFALVLQDGLGQGYAFNAHQIKFSAGTVVAGGLDDDVIANMEYQAYMDPTLGVTFEIDKL